MVRPGTRVKVRGVGAGSGLKSRLAAMGLLPGSVLEVVRNHMHGPLIVQIKESRLVLGRGMALKIDVA
jgi:Fe2+ transport system protein FeoA